MNYPLIIVSIVAVLCIIFYVVEQVSGWYNKAKSASSNKQPNVSPESAESTNQKTGTEILQAFLQENGCQVLN